MPRPAASAAICRANPQSTIRPRTVVGSSGVSSRLVGNSCSSSATGANRSPCSSTRSSTSSASNTSASGSPASTSSHIDRRRDRRPLARPQRVDADGGLVLVVLAPVDQHLVLAQLLPLARHDQLRVLRSRCRASACDERLGAVVVVHAVGVQRHVDLDALRARGLREALEAELRERVAQRAAPPRSTRRAPAGARVEVEGHHRRPLDLGDLRQRRVQLEVGEVRQPDERRQVVADAVLDRLRAEHDRLAAHPVRAVRGALLLVEVTRPRRRSGSASASAAGRAGAAAAPGATRV